MMTFKDLKKLVELPSYKEQRVPTVKALEVSGVPVVAEKILENHGSMENETVDVKQLGLVGRTKEQILQELVELYALQ